MRRIQDNFSGIRALAVPFLLPEQEENRRIKPVIKNQISVCNLRMNSYNSSKRLQKQLPIFYTLLKT